MAMLVTTTVRIATRPSGTFCPCAMVVRVPKDSRGSIVKGTVAHPASAGNRGVVRECPVHVRRAIRWIAVVVCPVRARAGEREPRTECIVVGPVKTGTHKKENVRAKWCTAPKGPLLWVEPTVRLRSV